MNNIFEKLREKIKSFFKRNNEKMLPKANFENEKIKKENRFFESLKVNSNNIKRVHSIKKENPYFGEVYKTYLIHVLKIYEEINGSDLSEEEKRTEFETRLTEYLEENKKYMETFLKQQTTNERLISLAETELYRGSDSLDYETTRNLYNTFLEDINIVSNDYEGKMYSTVLNNQKIFEEPILNENNNVCINSNIKYNFDMLKETYDFSKEHGKQIKFHTFLWHNAIPENLKSEIDSVSNPVLKRKMALAFLENYACGLSSFMKENGYELRQIEALNEIASDRNGEGVLRDSWWKDAIGENPENGDEYFIDVLKVVRNYFPETEIIYNEYNEFVNDKTDRIVDIIEQVKKVEKRDGVKLLDGIGLQAHYTDYLKEQNRSLTPRDIFDSAAKLQEACDEKKIYITEYDFLNFQKNGTKEQLEQAFKNSYLKISNGFIMWGNSDSLTWYHCVDKDGKSRNAQIIDSNGKPKPIYSRYREEFFSERAEPEKLGEER